jgi:PAS domain S-box-containing protein
VADQRSVVIASSDQTPMTGAGGDAEPGDVMIDLTTRGGVGALGGVLDAIPAMIAVHEGPDHRRVYANAAHARAFGTGPDAVPLGEAGAGRADEGELERFDRVFRTGETVEERERRMASAARGGAGDDGCWVRRVLRPWRGSDGAIRGVVAFAYDVTEQVALRSAADRHATELDLALDAGGGVGTWDWDVAADRVEVGGRFAALFGLDPDEAAGALPVSAFVDGILPKHRTRVRAAIAEAVAAGADFHEEYQVRNRDGGVRWVTARGRCHHDAAGRPTRFPGVVVDITEQVEARERLESSAAELRRSEERRRRAMAAGRVGTYEYYPQEERAVWDAMTLSIFGFEGDGPIALDRIAATIHPDDRPLWEADLAQALHPQGEGRHAIEMRITRASDGSVRWLQGKGQTTFEQGIPVLILGTVRDITERKRFEEKLRRLNRELNHRVKNLFAVTRGMIRLAARDEPEHAAFANRLGARVDALAAAQLTSMDAEGLEPVPLADMLDAVLRPFAVDHPGRIVSEGPALLVPRRLVTPLSLVLHELATNAFKHGAFARPGGALRIGWDVAQDDGGCRLDIDWREAGVGANDQAAVGGSDAAAGLTFGRRIIEASVRQMNATQETTWTGDGLVVRLHIPLEIDP